MANEVRNLVDRDKERAAESRRILERISREAHAGDASPVLRAARWARDHVAATDADQDDRIEQWGTRIGRVLGLAICAGLLVWLVVFLLRGA